MRKLLAVLMIAGLPMLARPAAATAARPADGQGDGIHAWRCPVAYLPARSTWVRTVTLRLVAGQVAELRIDGQAVHTFAAEGTLLLTAMDNERIAFDVATGQWDSDFRGRARGSGRCEREASGEAPGARPA
jgi:hypothetical protein